MSTPSVNHKSHMHQQQQQQQQTNEEQHTHSNSTNSSHATLMRSDSTSTVMLEEEIPLYRRHGLPTCTPSTWANLSIQLRSVLKTSGLFNNDMESSDRLNELFASGNEFNLQRLFSEANLNDINFDMNELMRSDSTRFIDGRTLSEFLRSESFDQLITATLNNTDPSFVPPADSCSSSFSELRPVSPELMTNNSFNGQHSQPQNQTSNELSFNQINSFNMPASSATSAPIDNNQGALNAIEHDHSFLIKRKENVDASMPTTSKRTPARGSRRTSTRIQSRAAASQVLASSSTSRERSSRQLISRAKDIRTTDDLNYYLERRRKNNEASKISRATRKQKYGDMNNKCVEYERVNAELRRKIVTLESVTTMLKSGLVNNFQRKN